MSRTSLGPPGADARTELRTLARLALPITLAQLGLVSMGLVDTAIIGRDSVQDLAAIGIARSIVFALTAFGMGIAFALEPLAAQAIGAGQPARAWGALRSTMRGCALLTAPSVALSLAATLLLEPMGVEAALIPRVRAYLVGHAPGFLPFLAYIVYRTFLQAHGETRPALVAAIAGNVVNAAMCGLLVRGDDMLEWLGLPRLGLPRLGPLGAGLATSAGSVVLAAIVVASARSRRPASAREPVAAGTIFRLGVPIGLHLSVAGGAFSLLGMIVGRLGAHAASAHQIAIGLSSFTFMGALGVAGATSVRVGHAIGAGASPRRSALLGLALGTSVMACGALVFSLAPRALVGLFTSDAEVIDIGAQLLHVAALFQLCDGVQVVAAGALRGAGDVRLPFLANIASHWLVGFPLTLLFGFALSLGAKGLWWGLTTGLVTNSIVLVIRLLRLTRRDIARVA
ncbi:multidrug transporter MatE [Sorangium cellulosum]|uniref:Multidrug-efflux transporter n=1 Tax=Sorangium cellulosum TaxID=56 RepID=A0A4P2PUM1_SORCE|nr:MATE family efflux transporter [Sorangium cellulosum]AUX20083.1 multidrug transporter MatE [Sorangium cellulosum]